jgi:hypothetical protein
MCEFQNNISEDENNDLPQSEAISENTGTDTNISQARIEVIQIL